MNLSLWDSLTSEVEKVSGKGFEVAGEVCGDNYICKSIVQYTNKKAEGGETALVMNWVDTHQKPSWCVFNFICEDIVKAALGKATSYQTKAINNWLHQKSLMILVI